MVRPCVAREFRRYGGSGLASMYPAFDWSVLLLAIMDISAPAISLADRPRLGHLGHQCSQAPGRPTSISSHPLADFGRKSISIWLRHCGFLILSGDLWSSA